MGMKSIIKKGIKREIIRIASSSYGPKLQKMLGGANEIVNMYAGREFRAEMNKKLSVFNLIGQDEIEIGSINPEGGENIRNGVIKIRILHGFPICFNVVKSVCAELKRDPKYDLRMVLFGDKVTELVSQMQDEGLEYIISSNYDMKLDHPDITVVYHLEVIYPPELLNMRIFSKYIVLIPLSIASIWFGKRTVSRMHLDFFKPDLCFVGNLCYDRLKPIIGETIIEEMSPPQFDIAFDYLVMTEDKKIPANWEKLRGKKTIMLMTDHGLRKNLISDEVSFDLYIEGLMHYFKENCDMGFIIRLHFELVSELIRTYWTLSDYNKFIKYCEQSENIVWDDTDDYLIGLDIADACLVDVNCSLVYYALAANKPIGVPLRFDMPVEINNQELVDNYYLIHSESEMIDFLEMIKQGIDNKKTDREKAFDMYISTYDGKNGRRIKEKIDIHYDDFLNGNKT